MGALWHPQLIYDIFCEKFTLDMPVDADALHLAIHPVI